MKIAMITDQHIGVRNNNKLFFDYFDEFYEEQFFPYIDKHGITTVVNAGDHLDNRKAINVLAGQQFDQSWIRNLTSRGLEEHSIVGNHTAYYRNTNKVNSLSHFYNDKPGLHLYESKPEEVEIGGLTWGMIPWITTDNKEECIDFLRNTKATIICGHFEIVGFYMDGGHRCENGLSINELNRFDRVFSGHFHKKQTVNNITYLGTPYDMTYADVGEQKGFHIFDTETLDLEFIPNPKKIFHKFYYDDVKNDYDFSEYDFSELKDCYVKLVVLSKKDHAKYETMIDMLTDVEIYKLDIVETVDEDLKTEGGVDMSLSTVEIISNYIDSSESTPHPEELKKLIGMLYTEAMNL